MCAFSCKFCHMKVFWNTEIRNPYNGKATLCTARGDEDCNIAHVCSVQKMLYRQAREEERARLNFIASVRPETAAAILGDETSSSSDVSSSAVIKIRSKS